MNLSNDAMLLLTALDKAAQQLLILGQIDPLREGASEVTPHLSLFAFQMREYNVSLYSRGTESIEIEVAGPDGIHDTGVLVKCNFAARGPCSIATQIERCNKQLALLNTVSSIETLLNFVYNSIGESRIAVVLVELEQAQKAAYAELRKVTAQ